VRFSPAIATCRRRPCPRWGKYFTRCGNRHRSLRASAGGRGKRDTQAAQNPANGPMKVSFRAIITSRQSGLEGRTSSLSRDRPSGSVFLRRPPAPGSLPLALRSLPFSATDFKTRSCFRNPVGPGEHACDGSGPGDRPRRVRKSGHGRIYAPYGFMLPRWSVRTQGFEQRSTTAYRFVEVRPLL